MPGFKKSLKQKSFFSYKIGFVGYRTQIDRVTTVCAEQMSNDTPIAPAITYYNVDHDTQSKMCNLVCKIKMARQSL